MALIQFENLPSTNTPIDAGNLNNNFNELNSNIQNLISVPTASGDWIYINLPNNFFIAYIPAKELNFISGECNISLPFNVVYNQTSVVAMPVWSNTGDAIIHGSIPDGSNVRLHMWDNNGTLYNGSNLTQVLVVGIKI